MSFFTKSWEWGDHAIYSYDTACLKLKEYILSIYNITDFNELLNSSVDYQQFMKGEIPNMQDIESDIHKKFYSTIKSSDEFKKLYCTIIQHIHTQFFPNEKVLIYQSFPSIRFQFIGNKAIPPHCDSDEIGKHPTGEHNFLIPLTEMTNTTRLFVESSSGKGDYQGIDMKYGDIFYFNGNKCIHYNQTNTENFLRVSFDFRTLKQSDYLRYITQENITSTNPRDISSCKPVKIVVGGYYQCFFPEESLQEMLSWYKISDKIQQSRPHFDEAEANAVSEYMRNGDPFITEFKKTTELEKKLAGFIGTNFCFMTTSGTTAIMTALYALGIQPNDEIIVPNYTMVATANAVKGIGAVPILCDVDRDTFTLRMTDVEKKRTIKTKAVIHVSLNNREANLQELRDYCDREGLFLIEDAAQSLGAFLPNGRHFGTVGHIGCFSLSTPKIISTGQGGFLITNDTSLGSRIHKIKNFGRKTGGVEEYETFGLNFKFTDLHAVIGIEQVKKLPSRINRLKAIYERYKAGLGKSEKYTFFDATSPYWIPWFIDILLTSSFDRPILQNFLTAHNIETRITYPALSEMELYRDQDSDEMTNSKIICHNGLFLPTHPILTDKEIDFITRIIRVFYNNQ